MYTVGTCDLCGGDEQGKYFRDVRPVKHPLLCRSSPARG
jgi:hypothetical protein